MNTLSRTMAAVLVFLAMSVTASAGDAARGMEQMLERAKSASDHEALAAQYDAEAKGLLAQAERHERMGQRYAGIELGGGKGPKFAKHCEALAGKLRDAARENEELAALHRELAAATDQ